MKLFTSLFVAALTALVFFTVSLLTGFGPLESFAATAGSFCVLGAVVDYGRRPVLRTAAVAYTTSEKLPLAA